MKDIMSVMEATEYLGISKPMLYLLLKTETFPSFRIGKRVLIRKESLDRWVEEQEKKNMDSKKNK